MMIYLHTYKNNDTETTHDFFNSDDNLYYSVTITNITRYYKVYTQEDSGVIAAHHVMFEYKLPKDLYIIYIHNNKSRYDDLIDSKFRIALNSI